MIYDDEVPVVENLGRRYYGNPRTGNVVATFWVGEYRDYALVDGGPWEWGTLTSRVRKLAEVILRDMGASSEMAMRYGQKLMVNVLCLCHRERPLMLTEEQILDAIGCKAIDSLNEVQ